MGDARGREPERTPGSIEPSTLLARANSAEELRKVASTLADHLSLAISAGRVGTWRWDRATDETQWDAAMEGLAGLPPGGFAGTKAAWEAIVHPEDRSDTLASLDAALETGGRYSIEHRFVWPDGSIHWIEGRGLVLVDRTGEISGAIGCSVDITERKRAELATLDELVHTTRRADRAHKEKERLEYLAEINRAALTAGTTTELMEAVANAAVPGLGDWCSIHFLREPGADPEIAVAHADPDKAAWARGLTTLFPYDPDSVTGVPHVIRSGRSEFVRRVDTSLIEASINQTGYDHDALREVIDAFAVTSVLTVPLRAKPGIIGAMRFVSAESGEAYTEDDLALAEAAAGSVATALDMVWKAEREQDVSVALQVALLPPALPTVDDMTLAARYWPAGAVTQVGGDFYDVFAIGPSRWAVLIGDVCGTGPDAASLTAIARHTIRAAARHGVVPSAVLEWVNEAILTSGRDRFCTVLYSTLTDLGGGQWSYEAVSGGHPFPIVVHADGSTDVVGRIGTLIGILDEIVVEPVAIELAAGDAIVLFTDGVTDVRRPYGLDDDQLRAMVAEAVVGAADAEEAIERLGAAVAALLPMADRNDDIALLVVSLGTRPD